MNISFPSLNGIFILYKSNKFKIINIKRTNVSVLGQHITNNAILSIIDTIDCIKIIIGLSVVNNSNCLSDVHLINRINSTYNHSICAIVDCINGFKQHYINHMHSIYHSPNDSA